MAEDAGVLSAHAGEVNVVRGFSLFNLVFLAGLLVAARVMVAGVERSGRDGAMQVRTRWAMLGGMLTLAGFVGSLMARTNASVSVRAIVISLAVLFGVVATRVLVTRAVAMPVSDHEFDPRFELQGVPAIVVESIPAAGDGFVRLPEGSGMAMPLRARSLDGAPIACGVEVGVERIDDGIAFVEMWSAIEARL